MASTVLMMQHFYFRSPTNSELAKTYLAKSKPIFTELTNNTTELIAEVHRHITTFDNQKYNRLKQQLYHIIQPLLSSPLWRSSGIVDIQTVALLHNGLQRLIDLQAQMDKALAEIIQEQTYVKAT